MQLQFILNTRTADGSATLLIGDLPRHPSVNRNARHTRNVIFSSARRERPLVPSVNFFFFFFLPDRSTLFSLSVRARIIEAPKWCPEKGDSKFGSRVAQTAGRPIEVKLYNLSITAGRTYNFQQTILPLRSSLLVNRKLKRLFPKHGAIALRLKSLKGRFSLFPHTDTST